MRIRIIAMSVASFILSADAALSDSLFDRVTPKADLPLRESPPGLFQSKGALVGTAASTETYRVLDERRVPTIVGSERWLKVGPADSSEAGLKEGWIYSGPSSDPTANVMMK